MEVGYATISVRAFFLCDGRFLGFYLIRTDSKFVVSANSNPQKGMMVMEFIIETKSLTKGYGTATVVDKINLHGPKEKIHRLHGRNRTGKTTAMKMMLQLAFQTDGSIRLLGKIIKTMPPSLSWVPLSQIKNKVHYIRGQLHFFLCGVKSRVSATPLPYL